MNNWLATCIRDEIPALTAAAGTPDMGAPKTLWHTTEGTSYAGARQAYANSGNGPHITATFEGGAFRAYQHLPLSSSASALVHNGGETNRDNVIQIEIVGTCDPGNRASWPAGSFVEDFPAAFYAGLAALAAAIEAETGCAHACGVPFEAYPASAGLSNGVRMGWDTWNAYSGHLGHQHAPENDHGDPGHIDIVAILGGPTPIPEDDMPRAITCTDPLSGGTWEVLTDDGEVDTDDGAPYLGGLNNHPEWNSMDVAHPVVAIEPWKGDGTNGGGNGYKIGEYDPNPPAGHGRVRWYRFPRDGRYAVAK